MDWLFRFFLAFQLVRSQWPLALLLWVGMVAATTMLAIGFIYPKAVEQQGLQHLLQGKPKEQRDLRLSISSFPVKTTTYPRLTAFINELDSRYLRSFADDAVQVGVTPPLQLVDAPPNSIEGPRGPRGVFEFVRELDREVKLVSGRFPLYQPGQVVERSDGALNVEVLTPAEVARAFGLEVGDTVRLQPTWADGPLLLADVVGIVEPISPDSTFWRAYRSLRTTASPPTTLVVYLSERTFVELLGNTFPQLQATFHWYWSVAPDKITPSNVRAVRSALRNLSGELASQLPAHSLTTELDNALDGYLDKVFFARLPMNLLVTLVVGVSLLFIAFVASRYAERHGFHVAQLKSRGASSFQVLSLFTFQGLALAVPAFLIGPPAAALVIMLSGYLPVFHTISQGDPFWPGLPRSAYGVALIGAGVSLVTFLTPVVRMTTQSLPSFFASVSRPQSQGPWRYWYFDLVLILLSGLLYWQLSQRGSFAASTVFGDRFQDSLLLAAPMLLMVAGVAVFIRLLPVLLRFVARLGKGAWGVSGTLLVQRLEDNPWAYAALFAVSVLTITLAVFAASFGSTLERHYQDRARYVSGADLRVTNVFPSGSGSTTTPLLTLSDGMAGDAEATPAYRGRASVLGREFSEGVTILAVSPDTFFRVAWFRDDFASKGLEQLMQRLAMPHEEVGKSLPLNTSLLRIQVHPIAPRPDSVMYARILDATGQYFNYPFGFLATSGWQEMSINLTEGPGLATSEGLVRASQSSPPRPPLTLLSLFVVPLQPLGPRDEPGGFYVDQMEASPAVPGPPVLVEDFEGSLQWRIIAGASTQRLDTLTTSTTFRTQGAQSLLYTWGAGPTASLRGFLWQKDDFQPVPVIVGRAFASDLGLKVGDSLVLSTGGTALVTRVADIATYFPTLDPTEEDFLIAPLAHFLRRVNALGLSGDTQPNEVWISGPDAMPQIVPSSLPGAGPGLLSGRVISAKDLAAEFRTDPLVVAGWKGFVLLAFGGAAFLSVISFAVASAVSFARYPSEIALMEATGLRPLQWFASYITGQMVLLALAIGAGLFLGFEIASGVTPFLALEKTTANPVPPLVLAPDWPRIMLFLVLVAGSWFAIMASILFLLWRTPAVGTYRGGVRLQ